MYKLDQAKQDELKAILKNNDEFVSEIEDQLMLIVCSRLFDASSFTLCFELLNEMTIYVLDIYDVSEFDIFNFSNMYHLETESIKDHQNYLIQTLFFDSKEELENFMIERLKERF